MASEVRCTTHHDACPCRQAAHERLVVAARAMVKASDRIDHDISYQGVICAIVPMNAWWAVVALLEGVAGEQ